MRRRSGVPTARHRVRVEHARAVTSYVDIHETAARTHRRSLRNPRRQVSLAQACPQRPALAGAAAMGSLAHLESTLIPLVKNLLILDTDGKRVAVKFFDSDTWPNTAAQNAFEKTLFTKTSRVNARGERACTYALASAAPSPPRPAGCRLLTRVASAEIIAFDNLLVVYKFVGDLHFYATADGDENEIVLAMVLGALVDTVSTLLACVPTHAPPAGPCAHAPVPWACSRRVASPAHAARWTRRARSRT